MSVSRVLIYGGRGALGEACVSHFKANNWWVASVDLHPNEAADTSITVNSEASWVDQEKNVLEAIATALAGEKLNAVVCVAGGWAGGNAAKELSKAADLMWRQSVWSSTISASVAANHLAPGGFLALTGAKAALEGTPSMIGYGMAKAAVHQLTKSLGSEFSGLPENSMAVAIMPITLDTPMNRKWMANADFTTWTPLSFVAEMFLKWGKGQDRPKSGSILTLITKNSETQLTVE
ncbi:dihydropteridine reductase [Arctopsyche grandis]|uniref:dihydropteridine reductase n=1 Tax=Arctopsyche grandis TaxID=121162 RepID=UPI00406D9E98